MRHLIPFVALAAILLTFSGAAGKEVTKMDAMTVESPAFKDNSTIPKQYTCDGKDINPPLVFRNIPPGARSLALIVDDPDAPAGIWVHWVVWNIDPGTREIKENSVPPGALQGQVPVERTTSGGRAAEVPSSSGPTGYFFKVYALGTRSLTLRRTSSANKT